MLAGLPDDIDPMLVSELDGYLAGIIVCPDLIMPGEWLPLVWGGGDEDSAPVFEDLAQAEKIAGLIMEHYNATIGDLTEGRYAPVFDVDPRHDEVLWEFWIDGFATAMALRPDSWMTIAASSDDDTRAALSGLITLGAIGRRESDLSETEIDELTDLAPDLIVHWVDTLNAWRLRQSTTPPPQRGNFGRVGRNDPCPCGSGKKYKKCCGLN
ncbi:UPF0149 family protein [Oricola sp.]|uniref:UPF0149 family protein n=1 Tax=Oricola sp. TaxID=1979950 RepID=UPI0025E68DD2|nr:UPF0149 family protein [Oricola sp.]MCI5073949.1 UPF0149 family protein [Oricola sp.]